MAPKNFVQKTIMVVKDIVIVVNMVVLLHWAFEAHAVSCKKARGVQLTVQCTSSNVCPTPNKVTDAEKRSTIEAESLRNCMFGIEVDIEEQTNRATRYVMAFIDTASDENWFFLKGLAAYFSDRPSEIQDLNSWIPGVDDRFLVMGSDKLVSDKEKTFTFGDGTYTTGIFYKANVTLLSMEAPISVPDMPFLGVDNTSFLNGHSLGRLLSHEPVIIGSFGFGVAAVHPQASGPETIRKIFKDNPDDIMISFWLNEKENNEKGCVFFGPVNNFQKWHVPDSFTWVRSIWAGHAFSILATVTVHFNMGDGHFGFEGQKKYTDETIVLDTGAATQIPEEFHKTYLSDRNKTSLDLWPTFVFTPKYTETSRVLELTLEPKDYARVVTNQNTKKQEFEPMCAKIRKADEKPRWIFGKDLFKKYFITYFHGSMDRDIEDRKMGFAEKKIGPDDCFVGTYQ